MHGAHFRRHRSERHGPCVEHVENAHLERRLNGWIPGGRLADGLFERELRLAGCAGQKPKGNQDTASLAHGMNKGRVRQTRHERGAHRSTWPPPPGGVTRGL